MNGQTVVDPGKGFTLQNEFVQFTFEPNGLGLSGMIDRKTGFNHIQEVEGNHLLWEIAFGKGTMRPRINNNYKSCSYIKLYKRPNGDQIAVLQWNKMRFWEEDNIVSVEVTIELPNSDGIAKWRILVQNLSDYWGLWEVACPSVNGFPSEGAYDVAMPVCGAGGTLLKSWAGSFKTRSPSGFFPMQFMSFNSGSNAVYFSSIDGESRTKDFSVDSRKKTLALIRYPENMGVTGSDLPDHYAVAFGPYQGGWLEAAHRYRNWALAKLYRVTGKKEYIEVAKFFLSERGHYNNGRAQYIFRNNPTYFQDHKPVLEQEETTGHALRACYMYAGMADIGAMSGSTEYIEASNRLWENATGKKIYLTGGVGASDTKGEAFDEAYVLPNLTAYSETYSAMANILWNFRLAKYYKDAKNFDVLERTLYNAYLPSSSIHGTGYLYTNPLADRGQTTRSDWFDPPCCPTNICRTTTSVPGYVYLTDDDNLYINLFMTSESKIDFGGREVIVNQETEYPWDGEIKIRLGMDKPSSFTLKIRVPGWAREEAIPLGLYRYMDKINKAVTLKVNGKDHKVGLDKGYTVIQNKWQSGDEISLSLPMEIRRVLSDERVKENNGRAALERGPLVFCVEGFDNNGKTSNIILPDESHLISRYVKDLIGGITVIEGKAKTSDNKGVTSISDFTAIPYFAWLNRGKGEMDIWLPRDEVKIN